MGRNRRVGRTRPVVLHVKEFGDGNSIINKFKPSSKSSSNSDQSGETHLRSKSDPKPAETASNKRQMEEEKKTPHGPEDHRCEAFF